jgi:type IV secretory pathway VirJ component
VRWTVAAAAAAWLPLAAAVALPQAGTQPTNGLPLKAVAPDSAGAQLVLILSGEAGRGPFEDALAAEFARSGAGAVVLDARSYLASAKTADTLASDVATIVRTYGARWHRSELIVVGYSRGADLAPFLANRLPGGLPTRLAEVAMVSPSGRATFELSLRDVVRTRARATDLPVMPELERLRGRAILCLYAGDERMAFCPRVDASLARVVRHPGARRLTADDAVTIARLVLGSAGT